MILEVAGLTLAALGLRQLYKIENFEKLELLKRFEKTIEIFANGKEYLDYKVIESKKTESGYDLTINIPPGSKFDDLEKLTPYLEASLGCDIRMRWVKKLKVAYLNLYTKDVEDIDKVKYKWDKIMRNAKLFNDNGETFELLNLTKQEKYGYDCTIKIPDGFSFKKLEEVNHILANAFGYIYVDYLEFTNKLPSRIVTKPLPDNYPFTPIETKPYQLYAGMTHYYHNHIVDMSSSPHILLSGATNSGKSVLLNMMLANQMHFHDEKAVEFYFIEVAEKTNDFDDFLKCKQVKGFGYTYDYAYKILSYLCEQIKERSQIFSKSRVKNIYQYNNKKSDEKLPFIYIVIEEMPAMMPDTQKTDPDFNIKTKCINLVETISAQGRFAGVYIISTLQRSDQASIRPLVKSNLNTRIALKQNNAASSLTVIDSVDAVTLPRRNAIILADGDYVRVKTPYLDSKVIYNTIKHCINKAHKMINFNQPKVPTPIQLEAYKKSKENENADEKSRGDVNIDGLSKQKR